MVGALIKDVAMKNKGIILLDVFFLCLVFLLANIRSIVYWGLFPPVYSFSDPGWREIVFWLVSFALMIFLLGKYNLYHSYVRVWQGQPILVVLILYSLFSVFWSTSWMVTLHRSLSFLFATSIAIYIGTRYSINRLFFILVIVGVTVLLASYISIFLLPKAGTDLNPPYNGAWRGIFWHKNHFGNILPIFILVCIIRMVSVGSFDYLDKIITATCYVLAFVAVVFSKSASGYILLLLLHLAFGACYLWLKVRSRLLTRHYQFLLIVAGVFGVIAMVYANSILSLFGKDITLTGRIPMWEILFRETFHLNPWFGHGFGTIWANESFRYYMRDLAGWAYPIMIGDNGFIDILLNLGIVGLMIFMYFYGKSWVDSVRYFLRDPKIENFFPFLFLFYTLLANITFSLFFETEVFIWIIIVAVSSICHREGDEWVVTTSFVPSSS